MYWSDWGTNAKIEKVGMDGSDRTVLVSHNVTWPNGLTLDYDTRRLYWTDAKSQTIQYSDLDGNNRQVHKFLEMLLLLMFKHEKS